MFDAVVALIADVGPAGIALVVGATILGGIAQSTVGFGAAFATVPALALVAPELLPGAMLTAMFPLTTLMVFVERGHLDTPAARRLSLARLPGIAVGTWIVVIADVRALTLVVGVVLLAAVVAAARGWTLAVTRRREWAAGMVSGVTGAATALGGPPLGLLYRDRDPAVVRPTLAVVWSTGIVVTLTSLTLAGEYDLLTATVGIGLSGVVLIGLAISRLVIARISPAGIRSAVLWWAGVGGLAALVRALLV